MLAVVACLALALACQDVTRPADATRTPPKGDVQSAPPVLLSLTCRIDSNSAAVSCKSPIPSPAAGISASVIYGSTPTYAQLYPINLVKDTVAQTWQFTAYLQNLLKQSIGTLNGTIVTGVKVFVTDFHATSGTGSVSVANADGTGTFTASNQPYWNYNQIVAPSGYTSNKLWKFNVPKTVTAVSLSILISTDFPAEQNVTALPTSTRPSWFDDDSSWTGAQHDGWLKRVITLCFKNGTTIGDRQLAVAYVNGAVVGGEPLSSGDGCYYVKVTDDGSGTLLNPAVNRLRGLPQVDVAAPTGGMSPGYMKPTDGANWTAWKLSPDDQIANDDNWALEMINAPMAWGCSTGSTSAGISVVDHAFEDVELLPNTVSGNSNLHAYPTEPNQHGSEVSSVLAAHGNDSVGITGVMWRAGLHIVELGSFHATFAEYGRFIEQEGNSGVKVVNFSYWKNWHRVLNTRADSDSVFADFNSMFFALRYANSAGHMPLLVTIAGNTNNDAFQSVMPILHDSLPQRSIIVGGNTRTRTHSTSWSSYGRLVDIYAPAEDVTMEVLLGGVLTPAGGNGTSLAAPLVTGIAGLLMSFDPTIPVDSLRAYILKGAARGNRPITAPDNSVHYLANAYEALRRAAQQPGAPLCGNRLWANNGEIVVQRDSTAPERLDNIGTLTSIDAVGTLAVEHGGKKIGICDFLSCTDVLDYGSSGWAAGSGSSYQTNSGAARASAGHSHDAAPSDTVVAAQPITSDRTRWSITRSINGGSAIQLAEIDLPPAPPDYAFAAYHVGASYPPQGANIIVFAHKQVQQSGGSFLSDTTWIYGIPTSTTSTIGVSHNILWRLPIEVFDQTISEDGKQLVTVVLSNATSPERCYYRYYSLVAPVGALLSDHQTSELTLCDAAPTLSPSVVASVREGDAGVRHGHAP